MMKNYTYQTDIAKWIELTGNIGGNVITFVVKLGSNPKIMDISSNVYQLFGYKKEDLINDENKIPFIIYQKDIKRLYLKINRLIYSKVKNHNLSFRVLTAVGTIKFVECFFFINKEKDDIQLIGYIIDTTQKKKFQDKIEYLTFYDSLTGLENRNKIKDIIDEELKSNLLYNRTSAILYLDLNRFKNVNDTLGHIIGDKLLQHVAHRLKSCIKEEDSLARIGDDEFVILLSNLNKKTLHSHIEIIAKRVYGILERPFLINGNLLHITASIGVAILGEDGKESNEILKNADTAMNLAKKDQDHYLRYYQNSMQKDTASKLEIENDLNLALKRGEFELYYQPQVDTKTDLIIGAEALIRWNHPKKGLISPFKFIPVAEDTGLIVAIGEWVLKEACRRIKELQDDPKTPKNFKKISVNISSKQFRLPTFTTDIKKIINDAEIDPSFLELEVTEGALISNLDGAIEKMLILKELGIKFSIDDFGTGYSSLTYLKKLPIDIIKIDKSFISNMHTDSDDKVLTQTIIQMSQNLRLGLIAEGVEKIEHLNFLQEKGCQSYQGYFFSKPIPFDKFRELLLDKVLLSDAA
jgi:diguanylate cyclase (GGDEF)-like protein/PAS domain S-box-containing protein